ncbi:MAG: hypothetical protein JOZ89_09225, partial [Gammaproteobacteria bacterium]|nr:hypothetical protein [Gammaproteobacteria bacterium]
MTEPRIQRQSRRLLLPAVLALFAPLCGRADVIDAVNALRYEGCGVSHRGMAPLRENARLDEAAHRLSQGTDLRTAEQFADYHAVSSFSVSISGVPSSGNIEAVVARQYCEQLTNPAFREIGAWRRGSVVWIALAEPFT